MAMTLFWSAFLTMGVIKPLSMATADSRLLYSAGLDVEMHTYPTTNKIHPDMLRDINRWIIQRCNEE